MTSFVDDDGNFLNYGGEDFLFTKQATLLYGDFKIKGDVSVTFDLPNTSINRKALGYVGPTQTGNPAFSLNTFTIIRNGTAVLRGNLAIQGQDDTKDVLNCFFVAGNGSWISLVQFNLKEIDTERYTVDWATEFQAQSSTQAGIIFPIVDYMSYYNKGNNYFNINPLRGGNGDNAINADDYFFELYPALYASTIMDEIAVKAGVKFAGTVLSQSLYKQIIITHDGADVQNPDAFITPRKAKVSFNSAFAVTGGVTTKVAFDRVISQGTKIPYDTVLKRWTGDASYGLDFNLYLNLSVSQSYTISIYANGVSVGSVTTIGTELNYNGSTGITKGGYFEIYILGAAGFNVNISSKLTIAPSSLVQLGNVRFCAVAPNMKAIDFIKWILTVFGAVASYEPTSKTISLNVLDKITDYEDWTEYFQDGTYYYNTIKANNYLRLPDPVEPDLIDYADSNVVKFGEGNVQTESELGGVEDIYESPIGAAKDDIGTTKPAILWPFIQNVELKDDVACVYTTVTNSAGLPVFNGVGWPFTALSSNCVIRIVDNKGNYSGYYTIDSANPATATTLKINGGVYVETSSGTIYIQKVVKKSAGNRALICLPSTAPNRFSTQSSFTTQVGSITAVNYAFFSKPMSGYAVDGIPISLSFGPINLTGYDSATLQDQYYLSIGGFFKNPFGKIEMIIPEAAIQRLNFTKWIYNKILNRYFFVQSVENYKDAQTPCLAYLMMK